MTDAYHPAYLAQAAVHERVEIQENVPLARDTYRVRFACPTLAERIVPGQFVMVRLAGSNDPLLGRPLALYDTVVSADGTRVGLDVVYLVMGKMTSRLAAMRGGQSLDVWGPLGNGFHSQTSILKKATSEDSPLSSGSHLVMVAGGIGQTPFVALAREQLGLRRYGTPPRPVVSAGRVTLCYGARSRDYLAGVEDFRTLGVEVRTSTDDGTAGHHGLVTDLLSDVLKESPQAHVVCCGPERMMHRVSEMTAERKVPCQVSLETPMACGIGICFSCVARVRDETGQWDYRRTCVEGPVFDARRIAW